MKKRLLTVLLAVCLVVALGTVTAMADDAVVTDVNGLKTAVQTSGTITIGADMEFSTEDIVTIPQGVTIVLDMQGHSITVDSDFTGRPIINNGTLTVTGNGTIDSSASKYGGYGAINNFGTLTIENGTYIGNINADGAAIYNRAGGELTINDGYFTGTAAINSAGRLTINDGSFWTDSCNQYKDENGKTHWAYCVISSGELYFYNGSVTGVQGALAINNGYAEVYDGDFQTVGCEHGTNGEYSFYALYIAGEEGEVEAHIYGGTYTAAYRVAVLCGNDNTGGDGGINARATANIHGGTFVGGNNAKSAMSAGTNTGDPTITGGTFTYKDTDGVKYSSDVSKYIADGAALIQNKETGAVITDESKTAIARVDGIGFTDLATAIAAADDGDTITLVGDVSEDINIEKNKVITLDLAGYRVTASTESIIKGNIIINDSSKGLGEYVGTVPISVEGGKLTLNGGNIKIENNKNGYGIYCSDGGAVEVNGGTIQSTYAPLTGNNTTGDMNFTVNGGKLTARYGPAIYMPGQGELTITDGVLNGGISLRMGQVNISGGTIYATNGSIDSPSEFYDYSGNAWLPDALYVFNGTYGSENVDKRNSLNIKITGGEFICENGQGSAVAIYDLGKVAQNSNVKISDDATLVTNASNRGAYQVLSLADIGVNTPAEGYGDNENVGRVETAISGGNFSDPVSDEYLDDGLTAELYSRSNPDAPYSYYPRVEDALEAAQPGDIVTDLSTVTSNTMYEVTFKYTDADSEVVSVRSGATITLPAPTRSGYEFRGWRDGSGELHKAGETVKVTSDMTFTAVWSAINIPDTYDIEIADTANGEVDTSLSNASAGSTITITATPDSGYSVASVTVTGPDGRVDVVRVNATTYTFKMPAGDVTVRVTFTDSDALPFTDVRAGQWFYDAVAYVYTNGMMEGDSATTFNPDGTMTRAMFWAVLGRIDGATITGTNWADQARDWAMAEGVSDGTDPNGLVTREQMVTMLWRYAGEPESSASLSAYTDADSVSDWAETAMRWAIDEGIITGMTDTTLVPQGTATRAQCAAIFMRFDQM